MNTFSANIRTEIHEKGIGNSSRRALETKKILDTVKRELYEETGALEFDKRGKETGIFIK